MTREAMIQIIRRHNDTVLFLKSLDSVVIPAEAVLKIMPLSVKMASLGLAITHEARELGINVKCCMQSGEIKAENGEVL